MTWPIVPLSEVAQVRLGRQRAPKNHQGDSMRPYIRAANVTRAGLSLTDVKEMNFTDAEMATYRMEPGDIILSEASGSASEVGKPALWTGEIADCAFQNTLIRVRPFSHEPKFLLHYFRWQALAGRFIEHSRGVGIHHLGRARLASWPTPLPSLDEQHRVVELLEDHLSRLDAAAAGIDNAARRLRALERSALDRNFGQDPSVQLGELVDDISAGKSFGSTNAPAREGEWGIIKVSAMTRGEFNPAENKAVQADRIDPRFEIQTGDLLVSRANTAAYVGASVLVRSVRPKLLLSDKSLRMTLRGDVRPEWLWRALQAPSARRQISALSTGTKDSMRNISQASLRQVLLPAATPSAQDQAIGAYESMRAGSSRLRDEVLKQNDQLSALRLSLFAAAFSGRLIRSVSELSHEQEMIPA